MSRSGTSAAPRAGSWARSATTGTPRGTRPGSGWCRSGFNGAITLKVTFAETCSGPDGPCSFDKLTEQWINEQAAKDLTTPPLNFNHLGYGGRLAGPVDNPKSSCLGCHQTAGFPTLPILPEFSANGSLLEPRCRRRARNRAELRMMYYGNAALGRVFSDTQLYSSDYSLQLSMSLQNFISLRCAEKAQQASTPRAIDLRTARPVVDSAEEVDRRSSHVRHTWTGRRSHRDEDERVVQREGVLVTLSHASNNEPCTTPMETRRFGRGPSAVVRTIPSANSIASAWAGCTAAALETGSPSASRTRA